MAYQGYGHGLGREIIETLYRAVVGDFAPDLTLILDMEVAAGLARARARQADTDAGETRYERMDKAFHEKLRAGFLYIAAREPERCVVIDAGGSIDDIADAVLSAVAKKLDAKLLSS